MKANRRHFRWLGWRAPVPACYFPISVSAPIGVPGATLEACVRGFRLHRAPITMDIRDRHSYRTCPIGWAERIDEPSHGSHALLRRQRRLGAAHIGPDGVVTSLKEEHENSASRIFSNDRDYLAPHVHSRRAKCSVRPCRNEMTLGVESVVGGCVS